MIINIINRFALSFFNAASASIGNLIATESCEKRYDIFKKYNFLGFWVFGWTAICLLILLNPFIEIWLGKEYLIDNLTLFLVILNYYLVGMRTTVGNVKMAAGLYVQDQWAPLIQSAINLIVSVLGAIYLGLPGVFLGTVVSSICVPCWYRPIIVYKYTFKKPIKNYFKKYFEYFFIVILSFCAVLFIEEILIHTFKLNMFYSFIVKIIICTLIPNMIIISN